MANTLMRPDDAIREITADVNAALDKLPPNERKAALHAWIDGVQTWNDFPKELVTTRVS